MNFIMSLLSKISVSLIYKLASYFQAIYFLYKTIYKRDKEIDTQTDVHKKNVEEAKKDGVVSKEEEEALRKSGRDIIRDSFH